jgi:hypothetical protein
MGKNGPPMMNLRGATGRPITDEYIDKFGIEAYAEFDKEVYIQVHGREAYDAKYGELEALGQEGTWEPCHKYMLGHGIVGVENLGGDLDKVAGKRFRFFCFPIRWYMGDGSMVRCSAEIDEADVNKDVPIAPTPTAASRGEGVTMEVTGTRGAVYRRPGISTCTACAWGRVTKTGFWMSISHFLPKGGCTCDATPLEKVPVLDGEVTMTGRASHAQSGTRSTSRRTRPARLKPPTRRRPCWLPSVPEPRGSAGPEGLGPDGVTRKDHGRWGRAAADASRVRVPARRPARGEGPAPPGLAPAHAHTRATGTTTTRPQGGHMPTDHHAALTGPGPT